MKKLLLIALCVGIVPMASYGFIYEAKILKKWNSQTNRYQWFIGLSDFHSKTHEANNAQLAHIDAILAKCDKKRTKVLIEDLSSAGSDGQQACGRFMVNSRGGILGGLVQACQEKQFDVENVEYRFCRVSSLGPVLNNVNKSPHIFPSVKAINVASLAQEIDAIANEINNYEDGHVLRRYYDKELGYINKQMAVFYDHHHLSAADFVEHHSTDENRRAYLNKLLTFDSGLMDTRVVHAVVNDDDHDFFLFIGGGAHIGRVSSALKENVHFESVYETKVHNAKEHDLSKCGSTPIVDKKYCVRPAAIDVKAAVAVLFAPTHAPPA